MRQETYLRALASLPLVTVHLGEFYVNRVRMPLANPPATGPTTVEVIKTEEKGSDVALATYLMFDACQGDCEASVVITNDSDLREPLRLVKDELGLTTGIINPHPAYRRSRAMTSTFLQAAAAFGPRAVSAICQDHRRARPRDPPPNGLVNQAWPMAPETQKARTRRALAPTHRSE